MTDHKLSDTMNHYIDDITTKWGPLPPNTGSTSLTLKGLKKRGLVESRITTSFISYAPWEVRLTESGAAIKAERARKREEQRRQWDEE